jgi:hypothetical protein
MNFLEVRGGGWDWDGVHAAGPPEPIDRAWHSSLPQPHSRTQPTLALSSRPLAGVSLTPSPLPRQRNQMREESGNEK